MSLIGQKVSLEDKTDYSNNFHAGGEGIIIEENRCMSTGAINGVYVMMKTGAVRSSQLQEITFLDPRSVEASVKDKGGNDLMNALSVLLSGNSRPMIA